MVVTSLVAAFPSSTQMLSLTVKMKVKVTKVILESTKWARIRFEELVWALVAVLVVVLVVVPVVIVVMVVLLATKVTASSCFSS